MTRFEEFKNMNVEEFADWLDEYGQFDGSPWTRWFDESYCSQCQPVMCHSSEDSREFPVAWCEIHDKCKHFQTLSDVPDNNEIIKMWLGMEVDG